MAASGPDPCPSDHKYRDTKILQKEVIQNYCCKAGYKEYENKNKQNLTK